MLRVALFSFHITFVFTLPHSLYLYVFYSNLTVIVNMHEIIMH